MSNSEEKQIKIVNGDVKDLNISTVYEHIKKESEIDEENNSKKKTIVIPKGQSDAQN